MLQGKFQIQIKTSSCFFIRDDKYLIWQRLKIKLLKFYNFMCL